MCKVVIFIIIDLLISRDSNFNNKSALLISFLRKLHLDSSIRHEIVSMSLIFSTRPNIV